MFSKFVSISTFSTNDLSSVVPSFWLTSASLLAFNIACGFSKYKFLFTKTSLNEDRATEVVSAWSVVVEFIVFIKNFISVSGNWMFCNIILATSILKFSNTLTAEPPPIPTSPAAAVALGMTISYELGSTFTAVWTAFNLAAVKDPIATASLNLTLRVPVWYNPWLGWVTLTLILVLLPELIILNGFADNNLLGNCLLTKWIVDFCEVLNDALLAVNFKSCVCCGVHVEAFCEVNKTPLYGCLVTFLDVSTKSVSPASEINTL